MKKELIFGLTLATGLVLAGAPALAEERRDVAPDGNGPAVAAAAIAAGVADGAPVRVFPTRDEHEKASARLALRGRPGGGSPDMTYHGGKIMTTSHTVAIFWGAGWGDATFVGDKFTGLDDFYAGFGGSPYQNTNTEYDGLGLFVGTTSQYLGRVVDTSAGPSRAPKTSTILAEVCKIASTVGNPAPDPDGNSYYAVYTDLKRGHAGYCAWHSSGTCNGSPVQFAFFFNLDGDAGCDPGDDPTVTGNSQGLAALANVSGHELSEALTDPSSPSAWYDSSGAENADKCAWTFGQPYVTLGSHKFKIQGNWSNAAYDGNQGYTDPSSGFVRGCIDGTN